MEQINRKLTMSRSPERWLKNTFRIYRHLAETNKKRLKSNRPTLKILHQDFQNSTPSWLGSTASITRRYMFEGYDCTPTQRMLFETYAKDLQHDPRKIHPG